MTHVAEPLYLQSTNNFSELARDLPSNNLIHDLPSQNDHNISYESRNRSGSVPSHKKAKQSDAKSVSTMVGTLPSYKSDNRIEDEELQKKGCGLFSGKTQFKKIKKNQAQSQKICCSLDKNGFIKSQALDITSIKYYFIKVAAKMGMIVIKDVQDLVTIKSQKIHPFHCLFLMCLPLMSDQNVYQLQRYRTEGGASTIKISLVSGSENIFNDFRRLFYFQLWQNNVLVLSNSQSISLLCMQKKQTLSLAVKKYQRACNEIQIKLLDSEQQVEVWQLQLMKEFKKCEQNVKRQIFSDSKSLSKGLQQDQAEASERKRIIKTPVSQITLQRILMHQIPICQFYLKLQMSNNCQLFQRKKRITNKYTLKQVYEYLQIDLFLLQEKHFHDGKRICQIDFQDLPFANAVRYLNQLNIILSPMENVSKITHFIKKLIQCNSRYKGKSQLIMDMDSQLPITILCTLITTNTQIKPIVSFLHDYFEPEDYFQQQNRALAALKASLEYIREDWKIDQLEKK